MCWPAELRRRARAVLVLAGIVAAVSTTPAAVGEVLQPDVASVAEPLTLIAPAAPGGGWDQLAREMERELEAHQQAAVQVENIPGAAGTIGLAQLIDGRRGRPRTLLVNGLVMLGAILWNESPVSIAQVTPIARVTGEWEIVAVPAASPFRDMAGLARALRDNPGGVSWGGGSAGGTDHILAGLIVAAADVDPRRTNYIAFSGGGEAATALLGGQVTAGISGYSEFAQYIESGRLRAIGISSPERVPGRDIPTLREQGLDVELANWRAVVAPPGIAEREREALTDLVARMVRTESWQATLTRLGWTDQFLAGPAFDAFLDSERIRVARIVSRLRGAGGGEAARAGEWVFPLVVLAACGCVLAGLGLRRYRGAPRVPDDGQSAPVVRLIVALGLFLALMETVGFVAAGTALFVLTASGFGSRTYARDAVAGLVFCALVYVAFTRGLGVPLP